MAKQLRVFTTFLAPLLIAMNVAHAAENRLTRDQLPAAVRVTADTQAKGATVRDYTTDVESGQREYEAEMTINGHSKDLTIAPNGRLLEIEEQTDLKSLPAQVVSSLRNRAGKGDIVKVESITKNGSIVAYEAQVHNAGRHSEIQVGPEGQTLNHQE
jgi:hypothetical protein